MTARGLAKQLRRVPVAWQVFIVMIALMGIGASAAGYVGLPEKVEANTTAIHSLQDQGDIQERLMLRMLCNQDPVRTWESCETQYGLRGDASY